MTKIECRGKEEFNTKEEANRAIFKVIYESCGGAMDLRPYKCKYCGKYHLTSTSK